jgi:hypothetical protein
MARRYGLIALGALIALLVVALPALQAGATHGGDTEVTDESPDSPFSQNKQNEPAVAIDAAHPTVVASGSNDNIDMEACNAGDPTTCPFSVDVGGSGIYFSFDSGDSWSQPTYTGITARDCLGPAECTPHVGPIGTLPWYAEEGLVSDGDPGLAFGPIPDENGEFSWDNGSRLYYSNLASVNSGAIEPPFKGPEAIAVSRIDGAPALTPAIVADKNSWKRPVVISKQSSTTFSDKEQIWADNVSTSPHFGNVYVCWASFRSNSSGNAAPQPMIVATSTDGGDTWTQKQVTSASNNPFNTKQGFGRSGCTVRTDSHGVVYVFAQKFAVGTPGAGAHIMVKSFDGGKSWTRPVDLFTATDTCFDVQFDGTGFRCVMDGDGGARDDLSASPSIDIANGAPDGENATDVIYNTWVDGRDGPNTVHVKLSYSRDGGRNWSTPANVEQPGDRGYYSAVGVSPDGTDAYLVYMAFTTPLLDDTTTARGLHGVVMHSNVNGSGAPTGWSVLNTGLLGDPRGSSQNNLVLEFLGDYVYAAATNEYGVAVWTDVRDATSCDDIQDWRAAVQEAQEVLADTRPEPQQDCAAGYGNTDIFGGSYGDPS